MIDDSDVKQQMNIVENGVNWNIKRYNDLKVINERLTKTLKAKLDDLDYQKKIYENLEAMKNAETEEGIFDYVEPPTFKAALYRVLINVPINRHENRKSKERD